MRTLTLPNGKKVLVDEQGNIIGTPPEQPPAPPSAQTPVPPQPAAQEPSPRGLSTPPLAQPSPITPEVAKALGEAQAPISTLTGIAQAQAQALARQQASKRASELGLERLQQRVFAPPDLQAAYNRLYQSAGLPDIKRRLEELDQQILRKQEEAQRAIRQVTTNPWLSQASRAGRAALIRKQAQDELNTLLRARDQLQELYQMGARELGTRLSLLTSQQQLDLQTLDALLKTAEKTAEPDALTQALISTLRYVPDYVKGLRLGKQYEQSLKKQVDEAYSSFVSETTDDPIVRAGLRLLPSLTTKFQADNLREALRRYQKTGDRDTAIQALINVATSRMSADERKRIHARLAVIKGLHRVKQLLDEWRQMGGDTNFFVGTMEEIRRRIGRTTDPHLVRIATEIANTLDMLSRSRTGAALTEHETTFYSRLFPSIGNVREVNDALISSLTNALVQSTADELTFSMGDAPEIRDAIVSRYALPASPSPKASEKELLSSGLFSVDEIRELERLFRTGGATTEDIAPGFDPSLYY